MQGTQEMHIMSPAPSFRESLGNMFMKINLDLANYKISICYLKEMVIVTTQIVMSPLSVTKTTLYIIKIIRRKEIIDTST